jgi:hypothetical protein
MPATKYYRDASGRLTFEMIRISAESYREACGGIAAAFQLAQDNAPVTNGWDIVFQDYRRGKQVIGLEWDNWTEFTIVSKTTSSDSLVEEIGAWMSQSKWSAEG